MQILPRLFTGALGGFGGGLSIDDGAVGAFSGTTDDGSVPVSLDGTVQPEPLAAAVTEATQDRMTGSVTCEPTAHAVAGAATLCRASQAVGPWYAVVRFTTDSGDVEAMTFMSGDG